MMVSSSRAMAATMGADEPPRRKKTQANNLMELRKQDVRRTQNVPVLKKKRGGGKARWIQEKPTAQRETQPSLITFGQRGIDAVLNGSTRHPVVYAS